MDIENNEKKQEETTQQEGFQREARRTPRPRIHTVQRPPFERQEYRRYDNNDEGGFRPEGFGAALHEGSSQQEYTPRNKYNNNNGYRPRTGGYQPRQGGYQPRQGQEGGYQPRQGGYQQRQSGGYQARQGQGGYQPRQGGFQKPYGKPYNPYKKGPRQHTADYDPNAKYSMKKRIEYK